VKLSALELPSVPGRTFGRPGVTALCRLLGEAARRSWVGVHVADAQHRTRGSVWSRNSGSHLTPDLIDDGRPKRIVGPWTDACTTT